MMISRATTEISSGAIQFTDLYTSYPLHRPDKAAMHESYVERVTLEHRFIAGAYSGFNSDSGVRRGDGRILRPFYFPFSHDQCIAIVHGEGEGESCRSLEGVFSLTCAA